MKRPDSKTRPWSTVTNPQSAPMQNRNRNPFYHTARWKKESKQFRVMHPLCSKCEEEGIIYPSEVTDHVIPLEICPDPWDWNNWDALCKKHNIKKGAKDKKLIQKAKR